MKNLCEEGAMCALFPLKSIDIAESIAQDSNCEIACYNSSSQVVLGGTASQISRAMELARSAKIRRIIPLKVSTAFHTRLMNPARDAFSKVLDSISFSSTCRADKEIISTITGRSLQISEIRSLLSDQLIRPVLFSQALSTLENSLDCVIHIGPGNSLIPSSLSIHHPSDLNTQLLGIIY
jgi:[acyl-carrier-protein] S-malonyltransferase